MSENKLNCEMRVIFGVISFIFLLSLIFGRLFALIGFLLTALIVYKGTCFGASIIGSIFCKKSVVSAMNNLVKEVKGSTGEAVDKAKEMTEDVVDRAKEVTEEVVDKVKDKTKKD